MPAKKEKKVVEIARVDILCLASRAILKLSIVEKYGIQFHIFPQFCKVIQRIGSEKLLGFSRNFHSN